MRSAANVNGQRCFRSDNLLLKVLVLRKSRIVPGGVKSVANGVSGKGCLRVKGKCGKRIMTGKKSG